MLIRLAILTCLESSACCKQVYKRTLASASLARPYAAFLVSPVDTGDLDTLPFGHIRSVLQHSSGAPARMGVSARGVAWKSWRIGALGVRWGCMAVLRAGHEPAELEPHVIVEQLGHRWKKRASRLTSNGRRAQRPLMSETLAMAFDGSALRQASGAPVPFRARHVTFVRVGADGRLEQASAVAEKQEMLRKLQAEDGLLAAWTGQYRTDVFWVDDLEAVREALA